MATDDIDAAIAGEELDWLVCHHWLGWRKGVRLLGQPPYMAGDTGHERPWPVSGEEEAADRLLAAIAQRGVAHAVRRLDDGSWQACLSGPTGLAAGGRAPTRALAIARALLRGVANGLAIKNPAR